MNTRISAPAEIRKTRQDVSTTLEKINVQKVFD